MTTRTAAIVIDNFLPDSEWNTIQVKIMVTIYIQRSLLKIEMNLTGLF